MPIINNIYYLDGSTLTIEDLALIIEHKIKINLTQEAWKRVHQSREIITEMMTDKDRIVYGINTGFGNFANKVISPSERSLLQNNLIRSHAVGVGKPLRPEIVKRMIILRINTLSKGRSGISPINLQKYIDACNANYLPMIPQKGTVGASGDLAPLSHLALGMMGQGLAWNQQSGKFSEAEAIMHQKGLTPIELKQKEGLALINGTQFMLSIVSEVLTLSLKILESAIIIYCYAFEIFGMQFDILSEQSIKFYGDHQKSMGQVLSKVKAYFDEQPSKLHEERTKNVDQNNQASSMIQAFQNFASVLESLSFCTRLITEEMNSTTDNPLVFSKADGFQENQLISAGNFHGEYVAKSSDYISMALHGLGRYSQARIERYLNERTSSLPGFLVFHGGLNSGYMIAQYTSAALVSECKVLAKPASTDSISTSASQEDHVSMGGFAARKSRQVLENVAYILGIQLLHCLQAVDIISLKPASSLAKIHAKVRQNGIEFNTEDKYFGPQMTIAKELVLNGLHNFIK